MWKPAVVLLAVLAFIWLAFSWLDAEREVRILCSMMPAGTPVGEAVAMLETGDYLRYESVRDGGERTLRVSSPFTLGTSRCTVRAEGGAVRSSVYRATVRLEWVAAWVGAMGLVGLALFQLAVAAGAPLGRMAWGGATERPGPGLRTASALVAVLLLLGAALLLERAGTVRFLGRPGLADGGAWALTVVFALSAVANALSRSSAERRVGIPLAMALAALCLVVALSG